MSGATVASILTGSVVPSLIETSIALAILIPCAACLDLALERLRRPHLRPIPWLLVLGRAAIPERFFDSFGSLGFVPGIVPSGVVPSGVVPSDLFTRATNGSTDLSTGALVGSDQLFAIGWIAGVIAFATFGALRYRSVRNRLLRRSTGEISPHWRSAAERAAQRLGLTRVPRLRAVPHLASPLVLGVWRPVVLVPPQLPTRGETGYEHVLLHEFAHLARRDPLLSSVSLTVQIIFWFHPLLWWARRRLSTAIELATDAHVAAVLREETTEYRSTLLRLASHTHRIRRPQTAGLGFFARRTNILRRLRALEERSSAGRTGQRWASIALALVLTVTLLPMCRVTDRTEKWAVADLTPQELLATDPAGCLLSRYAILALAAEESASEEARAPR